MWDSNKLNETVRIKTFEELEEHWKWLSFSSKALQLTVHYMHSHHIPARHKLQWLLREAFCEIAKQAAVTVACCTTLVMIAQQVAQRIFSDLPGSSLPVNVQVACKRQCVTCDSPLVTQVSTRQAQSGLSSVF